MLRLEYLICAATLYLDFVFRGYVTQFRYSLQKRYFIHCYVVAVKTSSTDLTF